MGNEHDARTLNACIVERSCAMPHSTIKNNLRSIVECCNNTHQGAPFTSNTRAFTSDLCGASHITFYLGEVVNACITVWQIYAGNTHQISSESAGLCGRHDKKHFGVLFLVHNVGLNTMAECCLALIVYTYRLHFPRSSAGRADVLFDKIDHRSCSEAIHCTVH